MKPRSKFSAIMNLKCPRCYEGDLFVNKSSYKIIGLGKMPSSCPHCGQDFGMEPGFYFGSTYVSYALAVAFFVPGYIANWLFFKLPFEWISAILVTIFLLLSPMIVRLARSGWIHFFVKYDPEASNEKKSAKGRALH